MDGPVLQRIAINTALTLPGSLQSQPFGPDYEVFKVGGKIFMMTTDVPGPQIVTLKCNQDRSMMLREVYPSITPGYHMNKRHWISIAAAPELAENLITDLVEHSYELVVRALPRGRHPSKKYSTCR